MNTPGPWIHSLACLMACLLLGSCSLRLPVQPSAPSPSPKIPATRASVMPAVAAQPDTVAVWLIADEFHTGMVFPYPWLIDSGFIPPQGFGDSQYVVMSWGNTDAYSERGIVGAGKWLQVLFTPTPSVMELIPVNWNLPEVLPKQRIWKSEVAASYGPRLAHFLNECSKSCADGRPLVVRPSSWGNGVQLEGNHAYFIPRVCNVWSAQAIECLGGDINPWLALTADGLARQVEHPVNGFKMVWNGLN